MRVVKSTPEEKHANQNERRGNGIPNKVHPMDALAATKPLVFVLDIKTILARFHLTNQPQQNSSIENSYEQFNVGRARTARRARSE